ncbi:hypothetical protein HC928_07925 [bacterium]|nr:hypothetical protein [bacterium]
MRYPVTLRELSSAAQANRWTASSTDPDCPNPGSSRQAIRPKTLMIGHNSDWLRLRLLA